MMNLGDGLTLQTRTVNGKQTTGIFVLDSNASKSKKKFNYKSKTLRYPIREKVPPIPKNAWENKVNKNQRSKLPSNAESDDKEKDENVKSLNSPRIKNKSDETNKKDKKPENLYSIIEQDVKNKRPVSKENNSSLNSKKRIPDIRPNKTKKEPSNSNKKEQNKKESGTNPKYVTLTQDQLNTILSLVKTKHEIDVGKVIEKKDDESDSESQKSSSKNETDNAAESDDEVVTIRPTSVPGLDLSEDENTTKNKDTKKEKKSSKRNKSEKEKKSKGNENNKEEDKSEKEEEKDSKEDTEKDGESFLQSSWGVLGGFGSRDKEKSRIEDQRQQWIKELNEQVNRNKKLKDDELQQRKGITSISSPEIDNQKNVQEANKEDESIMNLLNEEVQYKEKTSNRKNKEKTRKEALKKEEKSKKKIKSAPPSAKKTETEVTSTEPSVGRDLPAAIRSSFFPGESAPREHAYSASKQAQQRRWREELDKQREEQKTKREKEKNLRMSMEDDTLWARHFDTMEPKKVVERPADETPHDEQQLHANTYDGAANVAAPIPSARLPQNTNPQPENIVSQSSSSISVIAGGYVGKQESTGVRDPNKNNYLRTMTSLLDPAQIEAMEVRRKKQEEHRNAIAAQVEEQRRRKEAEDGQQRQRDAIEEERLRMERQQLDHQFEIEKLRQKMQESKREEQTNKLHQQLQEAEASALRDKLKQREKVLRARGHDTSLLEQAHNTALRSHRPAEPSKKSTVTLQPPVDNQPTSHQIETQHDLRSSNDLSPISLVANTEQGPIRLHISLNGIHNTSRETANQTTNTETQFSDTETEYLSLPQRRKENKKTKQTTKGNIKRATSLQKYENNLNAQYDKYSRREPNAINQPKQQKVKSDEPKPKWGAASKGKKFVPASQRYVKSMKWNEKHEQNVRRREEELLHQQALNDHEHLQAASRARFDEENDILTGRRRAASPPIPTLAHRMDEEREKKSYRSRSPNKTTTSKTNVAKNRSLSPVPKTKKLSPRQKQNTTQHTEVQRPDTVISVTTDKAKYRPGKHTRESPVPQTTDFVEYRRTSDVLNYGDETPPTPEPIRQQPVERQQQPDPMEQPIPNKDPLTNPDMVKQRERQDQILREISILRQGLLLKQREVASYPVAIPAQTPMMYGGNLPERTNDTPRE